MRIMLSLTLIMLVLLIGCQPPALLVRMVPDQQGLAVSKMNYYSDQGWFVKDKIAIIDVDGVMMNHSKSGLLGTGENPVNLFLEKLQAAESDPDVKAVVLRINSPGGSVSAADSMYHALQRFRQRTHKPVVASMLDVAASGGYYLACGCDHIVAQPSTLTGSIGTIMQTISVAGTMDKIGVRATAIKSGKLKDVGSPFHDLSEEERKLLTAIINDYYETFLHVVLTGRKNLTRETLMPVADGRVLTASQALQAGLIDRIGYPTDAIAWAKELANLSRIQVIMYHRPYGYKSTVYADTDMTQPQSLINVALPDWLNSPGTRFLYLWQVGS